MQKVRKYFSLVFQKSSENTTYQLYTEIYILVQLYAEKILTIESIQSTCENLKFDHILDRENIGIGTSNGGVSLPLKKSIII